MRTRLVASILAIFFGGLMAVIFSYIIILTFIDEIEFGREGIPYLTPNIYFIIAGLSVYMIYLGLKNFVKHRQNKLPKP